MILGLDVSTNYIGWCIIGKSGKVVDIGHWDLHLVKIKELKYRKIQTLFSDMVEDYPEISKIFVEAPLGASNNQFVCNILQRWNGMVCAMLFERSVIWPELIKETAARKHANIKVPKGVKGKEKKKFVLQFVQSLNIIDSTVWKLKRTGTPADFNFDMADSYLIAQAGYDGV